MKKIYNEDKERTNDDPDDPRDKPVKLSPHPNFEGSDVNLDYSAVHVPINVYEVRHLGFRSILSQFNLQMTWICQTLRHSFNYGAVRIVENGLVQVSSLKFFKWKFEFS